MLKKLLWGTSRRFANDVTNGVMKERKRREKTRILDKVEMYNKVSNHFYDRLNFIRDVNYLIRIVSEHYIEKNGTEEMNQLFRLMDYFDKQAKDLLSEPPVELSGVPLDIYCKGLTSYSEVVGNIELWVFKKTHMKINEDYLNEVIDDEDYKKELDHLFDRYPSVSVDYIDNIYLWDIEEEMEKSYEEFIRCGERVLEILEF
ncbi:hypothetical protein CUC15_04280 [Oceanobacillus zhaokaii]|uniref:Uncharacterized protein n=1 Tax=Oceanobacillus zhaokaii TaxID=2052660 RepID=A0A345PDZ8_9BACI|nr:hypothetical protein [Oceanobacillus zhaokaii]AXI08228.1 hypothetical protein CUC15_04280 [Oceanobacillus zhaokaii]